MNKNQIFTNLLTGFGSELLSDNDENNQYSLKQGILESIPYLFGNNTYSPVSDVQQQQYLQNKQEELRKQSYDNILQSLKDFKQNGGI